ncbi:MAG: CBS domain-containing protein, partial [Chloroflexi bacterium]
AYVLRHEILSNAAADRMDLTLKEIARPLHAVPETNTVSQVLEEFITRKDHMFLVFDEFGGMSGIITLEDALESLLGVEITDESDLVEDLREMARQRYERQTALLRQLGGLEEKGDTTTPTEEATEQPPEDTA